MQNQATILGEVVRLARIRLGLSQEQVAEKTGIDPRTILKIEQGAGNPLYHNLYALVRTLKINPSLLFYPEQVETKPTLSHLMQLLQDCSEEEAQTLMEMSQIFLAHVRHEDPFELVKKRRP